MKALFATFCLCLVCHSLLGESAQTLFEHSAKNVESEIAVAKTELLAKEKIVELTSRLEALNAQIAAMQKLLNAKQAENAKTKEAEQLLLKKIEDNKRQLQSLTNAVEKIFAECAEYVKTLPYPLNEIYSAKANKAQIAGSGVSAISRKIAFLESICADSKEYKLYEYPLNGKAAKFLTFGLSCSFYQILSTKECGKMSGKTPVEIKDASIKRLFDMAQNAAKITPAYLEQSK